MLYQKATMIKTSTYCISIIRYSILLLCVFIFSSNIARSSTDRIGSPFIYNYKTENFHGHPQNWGIVQSKYGLMFFANGNGVMVYDGNKWEMIELPGKTPPRAIGETQDGIVYTAGTNEIGYIQPGLKGRLEYLSLLDSLGLKQFGTVRDIITVENCAYFRSSEYVIRLSSEGFKYWKAKSTFSVIFLFNNEFYIDDEKFGLFKVDKDSLVLAPSGDEFINKDFRFAKQLNGKVILANRQKGLYSYEPNIITGNRLKNIASKANPVLVKNFVYCGTIGKNGDIIIGTSNGGCVVVDENGRLLSLINQKTGILQNKIHALYVDRDNLLWIASDKGITKCDYSGSISYWNEKHGLEGIVQSLIEYNNTFYAGTLQGLFYLKNGFFEKVQCPISQTWSFLKYKVPSSNQQILLIGTVEGVFVLQDNKFIRVSKAFPVFELYQSKKNPNIVLLGTEENIGILEYKKGSFSVLGFIPETGMGVRSIIEDLNNNIWATTYRDGVVKIQPSNNVLNPRKVKFYTKDDGFQSLKNILVYELNKNIVFATEQGILQYSQEQDTFLPDSIFKNAFGNSKDIFNLAEDSAGNIYITNLQNRRGSIAMAIKEANGHYQFISAPFNVIPPMMMLTSYIDSKGIYWIGGSEGLFRFNKNLINSYEKKISSRINQVTLNGDSCLFCGNNFIESHGKRYLTNIQNNISKYKINYKYNSLTFTYSALDFSDESTLLFRYKLEGYDNDWSEWTTTNTKEYTNLPEGKYRFSVSSKNIFDIIGEEATFEFHILSPWYRSTVAYIIYFLGILLTFTFSIRVYTRILIVQKQNLENTVKERTEEIRIQKEELQAQAEEMAAQSKELQAQSEVLLRINEELEKLSIVAQETDNAVIIMNENGEFLWINDGFTRLYGHTKEEFLQNYSSIFEVSTNPEIHQTIQDCLNSKESVVFESSATTKCGKTVYVQTTITPILNSKGIVEKLVAIDSDITKLKEAEFEIIQKNEEITSQKEELELHRFNLEKIVQERTVQLEIEKNKAEESDRLKSAFLANMSHEIRTPMNAIVGFANLLKIDDVTKEDKVEFIKEINANSNSLLQLIDDIINIAKIEAGQLNIIKKDFDINSLLKEIRGVFIQKIRSEYCKKIDLVLQLDNEDMEYIIYSDPVRIQQVISNLIDNAIKFTDDGSVEFGYKLDKEVDVSVLKFFVKDTGIGLSEEHQELIFNRFTKIETDRNKLYRGTGLGLTISKNIANLLDGKLYVESQLNKGSTFYFTLPIEKNSHIGVSETTSQSENTSKDWHDKAVLVAEDENSNYKLVEAILKRTKIKILRANNGEEVIEQFKTNDFDLVLMDIKMPIMNGLEATKAIRSINATVPIIALTAYAMDNDEKICLESGCSDYLSKPIQPSRLITMFQKYLTDK